MDNMGILVALHERLPTATQTILRRSVQAGRKTQTERQGQKLAVHSKAGVDRPTSMAILSGGQV